MTSRVRVIILVWYLSKMSYHNSSDVSISPRVWWYNTFDLRSTCRGFKNRAATLVKLFMHFHMSSSSIACYWPKGKHDALQLEGNCRSGFALAIHTTGSVYSFRLVAYEWEKSIHPTFLRMWASLRCLVAHMNRTNEQYILTLIWTYSSCRRDNLCRPS